MEYKQNRDLKISDLKNLEEKISVLLGENGRLRKDLGCSEADRLRTQDQLEVKKQLEMDLHEEIQEVELRASQAKKKAEVEEAKSGNLNLEVEKLRTEVGLKSEMIINLEAELKEKVIMTPTELQ